MRLVPEINQLVEATLIAVAMPQVPSVLDPVVPPGHRYMLSAHAIVPAGDDAVNVIIVPSG